MIQLIRHFFRWFAQSGLVSTRLVKTHYIVVVIPAMISVYTLSKIKYVALNQIISNKLDLLGITHFFGGFEQSGLTITIKFFLYSYFVQVPMATGFKPSNLGSGVNCSTNCAIIASQFLLLTYAKFLILACYVQQVRFFNEKESTVNRALDGSTYPG